MKTIKHIIAVAIIAASVMPVFNGCKKGENDPFLSLKSRKSRFAGEWNYSSGESKMTNQYTDITSGNSTTTTIDSKYDGSKETRTTVTTPGGYTNISTSDMTQEFTIEKDGTWKSTTVTISTYVDTITEYTPPSSLYEYRNTTVTTTTTDESGTWNFLSGVGEAKNKESVAVNTTTKKATSVQADSYVAITTGAPAKSATSSTTVQNWTYSTSYNVWKITQLKSKEMVIEGETNSTSSVTVDGAPSGTSTNDSGTYKMTMTAK